jgi:putative membrane protein
VRLPYTREQGFGSLGIQALVIEVDGQKTAYILMDGNNMVRGLREQILGRIQTIVESAEVMTTDSHVVNTISGKNPIGFSVSPEEITPHIEQAVRDAIADLSEARVATTTACCRRVIVFGSQRVTQLATTVNTIMVFIAPLSLAILLLAFLLSILAFIALG